MRINRLVPALAVFAVLLMPPAALAADPAAPAAAAADKAKKSNVEVREDRIKSVQRKPFLKKGRWELTPLFSLSINDAFYQKMGGGAAVAYHLADSLGLELQAVYVGTVQTDMVGFFQQANQALPKVSQLQYYLTANVMWSPLYGKLSLFTDAIVHFDAYLLGGFGVAQTETGPKFASNIGIGLRYFATSWLVIKIEVRDLMYTEKLKLDVQGEKFSDIQNHVMLSAGVSFFLPFDFNYHYQ
ncbi:MAG TPA: outer membrane beta-barrel domain-containing protein [Myxococcota bacterium]|nr:outer membrane beta-barrel domain-containing protein [Myxococcota bacterium]